MKNIKKRTLSRIPFLKSELVILSFLFITTCQASGISIGNKNVSAGETISISILASDFSDITGGEIYLQFDQSSFDYQGIESSYSSINSAIVLAQNNSINIVWASISDTINISGSKELLKVNLKAKTTSNTNLLLKDGSQIFDSNGNKVALSIAEDSLLQDKDVIVTTTTGNSNTQTTTQTITQNNNSNTQVTSNNLTTTSNNNENTNYKVPSVNGAGGNTIIIFSVIVTAIAVYFAFLIRRKKN